MAHFPEADLGGAWAVRRVEHVSWGSFARMIESSQPGRHDGDTVVENAKPKLKPPPLFKVVMLNDDFTPMEFVVHVLERFFSMDRTQATHVMLQVHTQGKAVCGIYPAQIAETRVSQVNEYARKHQHPLMSCLEEA